MDADNIGMRRYTFIALYQQRGINMFAVLALIGLFLAMGYAVLTFASNRVQSNLLEALAPIQQECQSAAGCPAIPRGWQPRECPANGDLPMARGCAAPPPDSAYHALVYRATPREFIVRWRYVQETELIVSGGKAREMTVQTNDV